MSALTRLSSVARAKGYPRVLSTGPSSLGPSDRLARGLGWFSIGLGLVELLAPRRVTRALGMRGSEGLVRACGAREIGAGMLALSVNRQLGLNSRIAGDLLDVALLARAMHWRNPKRDNVAIAMVAVLGITLLDIAGSAGLALRHRRGRGERRDFSGRSGFPKGVAAARGVARGRTPEDLRAAVGASD